MQISALLISPDRKSVFYFIFLIIIIQTALIPRYQTNPDVTKERSPTEACACGNMRVPEHACDLNLSFTAVLFQLSCSDPREEKKEKGQRWEKSYFRAAQCCGCRDIWEYWFKTRLIVLLLLGLKTMETAGIY